MTCLLDTSTYIWFVTDDRQLSGEANQLLEDADSIIYLSLVSIWELAIKSQLGRGLTLPKPFHQMVDEELAIDRFRLLSITVSHIKHVYNLPLIHRDPYDRLLIAQSLAEDLPIISSDSIFDRYPIQRLW